MPKKNWFLHIQGETSGPLPQSKVMLMLEQNEIHFSDFAWTQGHSAWARLSDIPEFASLMPEAPDAPLPTDEGGKTPERAMAPAAPVPAPRAMAALAEAPEAPPAFQAKKKPALKVVPEPKAAPVAKPTPAPAQAAPKTWVARYERVPMDGMVTVNGTDRYPIMNVSESGILMQMGQPIEVGSEVKFRVESKALEKVLDMTGIVIREANAQPKSIAIEFTRVNPAHRRMIKEYVAQKLAKK
jgi:hypothetical protein